MRITAALKAYGLSEAEASVYQVLLKLVEAPVFQIAKEANIPRTTAYKALEQLKVQGLVLSFHKNGVLFFTAESPNRLFDLAEDRKKMIEDVLPQLYGLIASAHVQPTIKAYTGSSAVRKAKEDIIDTLRHADRKELLVMANEAMYKLLPRYFPGWVKKRVAHGITAKLIVPSSAKDHEAFTPEAMQKNLSEVRYLPSHIAHQASVNIYGNKIALFSLEKDDPSAIIIESPALADMFRQYFLFNWAMLA